MVLYFNIILISNYFNNVCVYIQSLGGVEEGESLRNMEIINNV